MPLLVVFLLTALPLPWLAHILASAGSHVLDAHVVKRRERFTVDIALRVTGSRQACGLFGRPVPGRAPCWRASPVRRPPKEPAD
jgi:hypothetical protein